MRKEYDTLGEVLVPSDKLWGAQTQRSLENFRVGLEKMPLEVIKSLALVKKASAVVNKELGLLGEDKAALIAKAADAVIQGDLDEHFPLVV